MGQKILSGLNAFGVVLGLFLVPAVFSPLSTAGIQWLQTAPRSTLPFSVYAFFWNSRFSFLMLGGLFTFAAPIAALLFLIQRKKFWFTLSLGLSLMFWASWNMLPSNSLRESRHSALLRIAEQAKPVTAALEKYRTAHGEYPESLRELVPAYLPAVPRPDALGCPAYLYRLSAEYDKTRFRGYELKLNTPKTFLNWDCFVYWPEQEYPVSMYGGPVERIGSWAYVHE